MLKFLKYIFYFATAFLMYSNSSASDKGKVDAESECENFIFIQGSSNINRFRLVNQSPRIKTGSELNGIARNREIQIPVDEFTAANNHMLKDFYDMVKASQYPYIHIAIEPRNRADFDETTGMTNFRTEISIAGKSRNYIVPCEINFCENETLVLKGTLQVKLTDFEIEPPQKIFGAVKVNNEVFINFAFRLEPEEILTEKITF